MREKKISFSEFKIWNECAFKHKLVYIDGLKSFQGNEYTAFGTAMHHVCELYVQGDTSDGKNSFKKKFVEELKKLPSLEAVNKKLVLEMRKQGEALVDHILPALTDRFEEYDVVSVEEFLYEKMEEINPEFNFKGFIDLVIKTKDGKYHVIDWKTCSWGWNAKKKNDPMSVYQLSFYKNFFSNKHGIPPDNIETHFALLKRTAKKEKVEIFRVTNGPKRISNALNLLSRALTHINDKNYVKNRLSCERCEFYKTSHCP